MAKDNCQKIKLLRLMEILRQETDEQHPLRATEICNRLISMGITCDRRTLTKDNRNSVRINLEVYRKWIL